MQKLIRVACITLITIFAISSNAYAAPTQCPLIPPSLSSSDWTVVGTPSGNFSSAVVVVSADDILYCYYDANQGMGFLQSNFQVNDQTLNPQVWKNPHYCPLGKCKICNTSAAACQFEAQ